MEQLVDDLELFNRSTDEDLIKIKCASCGLICNTRKCVISQHAKIGGFCRCSLKCFYEHNKTGETRHCNNCHKEIYVTKCRKIEMDNKPIYCSHKCRRKQPMIKNGIYDCECKICKKKFGHHSHRKKSCSEKCRKILQSQTNKQNQLCNKKIIRSKNEILMFEKIKQIFPDAINNEFIFNGFDADIIIPRLKCCLHWNGIHHDKAIYPDQVLKETKKKDIKRYNEIEKHGYTNYIIKDIGSFNPEKVEHELRMFSDYLESELYY